MTAPLYRRERILEFLEERTYARVAELARDLECSEMTIRRDLTYLESKGFLERSRGGAIPTRRVRLEFALAGRSDARRGEKEAIGRAAVELVSPGDRVLLDTGTTVLSMARELRSAERVTVTTTSLAVISVLLPARGVEVMLTGGMVRDSSPDLYGPLVEDNLARIHADWAFIGCDGLSVEGGLTTTDPRVAKATALMAAGARRAALLTDSSKAGRDSFITFARFGDLDYLITDDGMPPKILAEARRAGVETIVVEARESQ